VNLTEIEREILLAVARQKVADEGVERLRLLLGSDARWETLIESAWRHGVAPLMCWHISRVDGGGLIPAAIRHSLRQCYVRAAFRNSFHIGQLALALRALADGGVGVIVLKGAHLAPLVYGDPALRPFADIDLLVCPGDVDRALILLAGAGYDLAPGLLSVALNRRYHVNLPLLKRGDRPVHVELHWRLTDRFSSHAMEHEAIWARSREVQIGGAPARVLAPEDLVVYLALHLDKHGYLNRGVVGSGRERAFALDGLSANRLIWFTDLHEVCERHGGALDWGTVVERSRTWGMADSVGTSLAMLVALLGTIVGDGALKALGGGTAGWFRRWLAGRLSHSGCGARDRTRDFVRRMMLPTRKDFELRLVRLLDLGEFLFPGRGSCPARATWGAGKILAHAIRGMAMCVGLMAGVLGCHARARFARLMGAGGHDRG